MTIGGDTGNLGYGVEEFYYPSPSAISTPVENENMRSACRPEPLADELLRVSTYPNPVVQGPMTIEVEIAAKERVYIGVFDAQGVLVRPIHEGVLQGKKRISFTTSSSGLKPGVYYLHLVGDKRSLTRRLIVKE